MWKILLFYISCLLSVKLDHVLEYYLIIKRKPILILWYSEICLNQTFLEITFVIVLVTQLSLYFDYA
jgi:hypothetical protein